MKKEKRKSNIEVLRILAIIMIIAHHYCVHGGWTSRVSGLTLNNAVLDFLIIGGKLGVAIFIIISGYFGIKSEFKPKKIIKLLLQVVFYTMLFGIVNIAINGWCGIKAFVKMCLPTTFSVYWFMTAYCVLYLLSPYINKLFHSLDKKQIIRLLIIMGTLCCGIFPTLLHIRYQTNDLFIFVFLYILGGYISMYCAERKYKYSLWVGIFSYLAIFAIQLLFETKFTSYINYFTDLYSLPIILCAIAIFLYFKDINVQNKFINIIASATFGVYLIHENTYVRPFLWQKLFNNDAFYNSKWLIIHSFICIIVTYIICTIIELIRTYCIEKRTLPLIYKLYDSLIDKIKNTNIYRKWEKL